ncbi:transposase [Nitrobacteraceae bacterium AZCC 2161]
MIVCIVMPPEGRRPASVEALRASSGFVRWRRFPFVERIFADGGYQGPKMAKTVAATGCWKIEIVKRSDLHRFVVLPKRWIVERTFAWISRNRRLMRDFERYTRTVAAFVRLAMIRIMLRRLTRSTQCS